MKACCSLCAGPLRAACRQKVQSLRKIRAVRSDAAQPPSRRHRLSAQSLRKLRVVRNEGGRKSSGKV
jgi:hypothetical protein